MTDIHSHIMFGVDDGSSSIEESLNLLRELKSVGFDNVILTPHYINGDTYSVPNDEKIRRLNILREEVRKNHIDINLYLGNEIFISKNMIHDIEVGNACTLNHSKYFLFEIPFHNKINYLIDFVYEIKHKGYIPILAHPERYTYFQDNYSLVDDLKEEGVLFQCNYASILGYYGKDAEKLMKYMLKHRYVDYLGTDIHHIHSSFVIDNFKKIEKHLKRIAGEGYYQKIMDSNDNLLR